MKISIIFPFYRGGKVPELLERIYSVIKENGYNYEIIAVSDGSKDEVFNVIKKFADKDRNLKVLRFKVNAGQTAAIRAGIEYATGDILIPMDSDLENDPRDIPALLAKIDEGFDVVSGWRQNRWKGNYMTRKLPSVMANALISKITGVKLHDYGCTLKAYRRGVIQGVPLYGEMHRFIPAFASMQGGRVTEIPVRYEPRSFGKSYYGISRTFRVLLDLVLIKFLHKYMDRPMHFFGGLGFISLAIGILAGLTSALFKIIGFRDFVSTPLPIFSALFLIVGVQMIAMGVIAEMIMRVYYETRDKKPYLIKDKLNI